MQALWHLNRRVKFPRVFILTCRVFGLGSRLVRCEPCKNDLRLWKPGACNIFDSQYALSLVRMHYDKLDLARPIEPRDAHQIQTIDAQSHFNSRSAQRLSYSHNRLLQKWFERGAISVMLVRVDLCSTMALHYLRDLPGGHHPRHQSLHNQIDHRT